MSPSPLGLGKYVQQCRLALGLSANALGQKLKTSHSTITKLERGEIQRPTTELLHKLARALQVDYEELASRAGYIVPGVVYLRTKQPLTDEEAAEVREIVDYVLSKRQREGGSDESNTADQAA